jgi:hypothetical protein
MTMFSRREPQPIVLPASRREAASQATMVNLTGLCPGALAHCSCGHIVESGDRFCGSCGVQLRDVFVPMAGY